MEVGIRHYGMHVQPIEETLVEFPPVGIYNRKHVGCCESSTLGPEAPHAAEKVFGMNSETFLTGRVLNPHGRQRISDSLLDSRGKWSTM